MANTWSPRTLPLTPGASVIVGVVTNQAVATPDGYPVSAQGALYHVVKIVASGVTVVGSITAKLQTAIGGEWVDSKTVVISANGNFYISLNNAVEDDQAFLPLLAAARVVVTTTNAGDRLTVGSVSVLQAG